MFLKKRNKFKKAPIKLDFNMLGNTIDYLKIFEYRDYYCSAYNSLGYQKFKIDKNIEIKIVQYGYMQDHDPLRDENKTMFYNFLRIVIVINNIDVIEFNLEEKQPNRWTVNEINKKFKLSHDIDRVINTWCYKQLKKKKLKKIKIKNYKIIKLFLKII